MKKEMWEYSYDELMEVIKYYEDLSSLRCLTQSEMIEYENFKGELYWRCA